MRTKLHLPIDHGQFNLFCIVSLEGGKPMQKFIEQNAQSPDVDTMIILLALYHFWGHVLVGAAEGVSFGVNALSDPPEVTQLDVEILVEE